MTHVNTTILTLTSARAYHGSLVAGKSYQLCVRIVRNRVYKNGYDLFEANDLSLVSYKMNSKIYYALSTSGQNQWFNDEYLSHRTPMEPRHGCKLEEFADASFS